MKFKNGSDGNPLDHSKTDLSQAVLTGKGTLMLVILIKRLAEAENKSTFQIIEEVDAEIASRSSGGS